jgi:disulfide bond formation protein DsbB
MYYWLHTLNFLFALGGLILIPIIIGLYADYFFNESKFFKQWLQKFVWPAVIAITIGSVAISLLYSEYFGFVPCSLCWLQRIALYPQALFALMAFKTKEHVFFPLYSIALSLFGLGVGIYHYVYQLLPQETSTSEILPCLADGTADCAVRVINEFGFVTFPLLSAITFALLIVLYLNLRRSQ